MGVAMAAFLSASPVMGQEAADLRRDAQDLERRILGKSSEDFYASEDESVVVFSGVMDLGVYDDIDEPAVARALARVDLVFDITAGSVVGEIYEVVQESGDIGGLAGSTLPLEGYMTKQETGGIGIWVSAPLQSVGRATQATKVSFKMELTLRGSEAPRVSYGPVVGELRRSGGVEKQILGAVGALEVGAGL